MVFVKVQKNKSYFKRYQTKFRRRRDCITDYQQRRNMIVQDKNKYETPKYRVVVRITSTDIICQIFSSGLKNDKCLVAAYAHELRRYGVKCGFTNYASAYCTGLLLARRLDAKLKLGYDGKKDISGEEYHVEPIEGKRTPFKAFLDIGLHRTTTGARIFGCLKGAADGGINIPHNTRRFPGSHYEKESKKLTYDPEVHRRRILGLHVADYMRDLEKNEPEKFKAHFSRVIASGVTADNISQMYIDAHKKIRENPLIPRGPLEKGNLLTRAKPKTKDFPKKRWGPQKMSIQQRKAAIKTKIALIIKKREEEWKKFGKPIKKVRKARKEKEDIAAEQKALEPVPEGTPAEGEAKEGEEGEGKGEEKKEGAKGKEAAPAGKGGKEAAGKGKEAGKGGKEAAPAKGGKEAAPAKGGKEAAPAKGGKEAAPAAKGGKKK